MKDAEASETGWPLVNVPDWLRPRTEALIAELGEAHPDVQLFVSILQAGVIDDTIVDRLPACRGGRDKRCLADRNRPFL